MLLMARMTFLPSHVCPITFASNLYRSATLLANKHVNHNIMPALSTYLAIFYRLPAHIFFLPVRPHSSYPPALLAFGFARYPLVWPIPSPSARTTRLSSDPEVQ